MFWRSGISTKSDSGIKLCGPDPEPMEFIIKTCFDFNWFLEKMLPTTHFTDNLENLESTGFSCGKSDKYFAREQLERCGYKQIDLSTSSKQQVTMVKGCRLSPC